MRYGLLNAALPTPSGQFLVQQRPHGRVDVLNGPAAMLDLAARVQHQVLARRNRRR
ncbi:hypothetical protein VSR01_28290 [Actinacidiphila sp. DG2A-62]|uniref:hypothetical protein n=1 Tax=Actinacidiphila sp. DG2A-62 TaxID=3108821 RepID=UPI002DB7B598|nr:hypothetical protein [Actinacidiphila sp. DG2A-62]MEC3997192.1 hypothetical protein [Actinacidiphila sp. DG2A-62]